MEINASTPLNLPALTVSGGQIRAANLSLGQQLIAAVVATNQNGQVTLNVDNALLNARTQLLLTEGQLLNLMVAQTGKQVVLKLTDQSLHAALISQALRTNLPKQSGMTELLANLGAITQQNSKDAVKQLPAPVQQLARQIIQKLPSEKDVSTGEGLKRALQNSGVFLENKLGNAVKQQNVQNQIQQDFKRELLTLRQTITRELGFPDKQSAAAATQSAVKSPSGTTQTTGTTTQPIPQPVQQALRAIRPEQLQQLIQQLPKETPKEIVQQFQQISSSITHITKLQTTAAASTTPETTKQSTDTVIRSLLQNLAPQINNVMQFIQTQPLLMKQETSKQMDAVTKLLAQLFGATQTKTKEVSQPPPPMPRGNTQAQGHASPSLLNINDTQHALREMLRQSDGALARLQMHQTSSLMEQEAGRMSMALELPVRRGEDTDLVHMRIQEEERQNEDEPFANGITVVISLDLENTGPVHAKITVRKETVSVVFWAEEEDTLKKAIEDMDELEQRFARVGLKPDQMSFLPGKPPEGPAKVYNKQLLDIKV